MKEIELRPACETDFGAMRPIFQEILASGDKFPFEDGSREACQEPGYVDAHVMYRLLDDPNDWPL